MQSFSREFFCFLFLPWHSSGLTEKKKIYFKITEVLERVKQETEEKGSSMTDGGKYGFP